VVDAHLHAVPIDLVQQRHDLVQVERQDVRHRARQTGLRCGPDRHQLGLLLPHGAFRVNAVQPGAHRCLLALLDLLDGAAERVLFEESDAPIPASSPSQTDPVSAATAPEAIAAASILPSSPMSKMPERSENKPARQANNSGVASRSVVSRSCRSVL
jgi:hypothetical protein